MNSDKVRAVEHRLDSNLLHDHPWDSDLFTLDEFIEMCRIGAVSNFDGNGYYGTATKMSEIDASPLRIITGTIDRSWSHVVWFNK